MNTSVASYAPKGKTYSLTNSLLCRVSIAAGVSNLGYERFWKDIASSFDIELDGNITTILKLRVEQNKNRKKV